MPVGFSTYNSSLSPILVAIVTSNTRSCLCVTPDYKNWYLTGSIMKGTGLPRGVAYDSTAKKIYLLTAEASPNMFKGGPVAAFRSPTSMTSNGSFATNIAGNLLYIDGANIMYGGATSICYLSQNGGSTWISRNTWSSASTRNPSVIRYFASVQKYINGMVEVTPLGRTTTGGSFNSVWTGDTAALADPGWGNTTGRVRHIEEGTTGNFVVVGKTTVGKLSTSTNLDTWTNRNWVSNDEVFFVAWNGTMWVAVGANGVIGTSTDVNGATWTARTSGISTTLVWVGWDSNLSKWITVSANYEILTSSDGITWANNNATTTNFLPANTPLAQISKVRNA
jgi:hypothetical protein